jgi:hypothetical protein
MTAGGPLELLASGWTDGIPRRIASARPDGTRTGRITRTAVDAQQNVRVTSHG